MESIIFLTFFIYSYLAEVTCGSHENYFIVEQLLNRLNQKESLKEEEGLDGPHYEDQWWTGGKSFVSILKF